MRLAHQVFFTLTERTDEAIESLVNDCGEYLAGHDGLVSFEVGRREPRYTRPVNADFDVALHTVFEDQASHDKYQVSDRHLAFIEKNKATWATVQVFDSNLT
ncbi:MAG: Dabb family protein [Planctomycetota bacterium]